MDGRERKKTSLLLLRLAAIVFGLVTLAEAALAAWLLFTPGVGVSIAVPSDEKWAVILLIIAPPVLAALSLLLLRQERKP